MKYIIPSYQRAKRLEKNTLSFLEKHKIPNKDIYIFLRVDDKELNHYYLLKDKGYNIIILNDTKGIGRTHNYITEWGEEGEFICEIDDDLVDMIDTENKPIEDFKSVVDELVNEIEQKGFSYGGFYSTPNPFFMKNIKTKYTYDLRYMLGLIRVRIIRKDIVLETNFSEDFECCIKHYIRDGGIVKNNYCAGKTSNYAIGGCNGDGRDNITEKNDKMFLAEKYPTYCKIFQRKNQKWDLRLKHKKSK